VTTLACCATTQREGSRPCRPEQRPPVSAWSSDDLRRPECRRPVPERSRPCSPTRALPRAPGGTRASARFPTAPRRSAPRCRRDRLAAPAVPSGLAAATSRPSGARGRSAYDSPPAGPARAPGGTPVGGPRLAGRPCRTVPAMLHRAQSPAVPPQRHRGAGGPRPRWQRTRARPVEPRLPIALPGHPPPVWRRTSPSD
jgi:hypothetical protein